MDMEYSRENIEQLLEGKLQEAVDNFGKKELRIIDIGVFPWHSEISVSFLFSEDSAEEDDIAAWPYFDYSKIFAGDWEQARELAKKMNEMWAINNDPIPFFSDFGSALTSDRISSVIKRFNLAPDFRIQVLNPDDPNSKNFCT